MTPDQRFQLILTALGVVFIPILILMYRAVVKWTRTEDKLGELVTDVSKLIEDKEKTHAAMLQQMSDDRKATDRRLRWLEEHYWKGRE